MEFIIVAALVGGYFYWKSTRTVWNSGGKAVDWSQSNDLSTTQWFVLDPNSWAPERSFVEAEIARAVAENVKSRVAFHARRSSAPDKPANATGEMTVHGTVISSVVEASGRRVFTVRVDSINNPPKDAEVLINTNVKVPDTALTYIGRSLK